MDADPLGFWIPIPNHRSAPLLISAAETMTARLMQSKVRPSCSKVEDTDGTAKELFVAWIKL